MDTQKLTGDELDDRLDEVKCFLDARESSPGPAYWRLSVHGDDVDGNFCHDCIQELCPNGEVGTDYSFYGCAPEQDGSLQCDNCGRTLEYVLDDRGVDEELECYSEDTPDLSNADTCFHLARIAHGAYTVDQKRAIVRIVERARHKGDA